MNIISFLVNNYVRIKEKIGFILSEKEEWLLILDDANKMMDMILRVKRMQQKLEERQQKLGRSLQGQGQLLPDLGDKIKTERPKFKNDEDITLYIR